MIIIYMYDIQLAVIFYQTICHIPYQLPVSTDFTFL